MVSVNIKTDKLTIQVSAGINGCSFDWLIFVDKSFTTFNLLEHVNAIVGRNAIL